MFVAMEDSVNSRTKKIACAKSLQFESHPCFSSDSSSGSPQHGGYGSRVVVSTEGGGGGGPNLEIERTLPGVILSHQKSYCQFFIDLSDLGCMLGNARLRDGARYGHSFIFFSVCLLFVEKSSSVWGANHRQGGFRSLLYVPYSLISVKDP